MGTGISHTRSNVRTALQEMYDKDECWYGAKPRLRSSLFLWLTSRLKTFKTTRNLRRHEKVSTQLFVSIWWGFITSVKKVTSWHAYVGTELRRTNTSNVFAASALERGGWSATLPGRFIPGKDLVLYLLLRRQGASARKITPHLEPVHRLSSPQQVAIPPAQCRPTLVIPY